MLTVVNIWNRNSAFGALGLTLNDPSNGYIVQSIQGLDPVKATLVASSFANLDGEQHHSSKKESRNIRFQIGLKKGHPTLSISALRAKLYSVFMPETEIRLQFITSEGLLVEIDGVVETCETALFSKEPAVDISVMCYAPDFLDPEPNSILGTSEVDVPINYEGTVSTGITFIMTDGGSLPSFTLKMKHQGVLTKTLYFDTDIFAGDIITIATTKGERSATRYKTGPGTTEDILWAIRGISDWPILRPGLNEIRLDVPFNMEGFEYTVEWVTRHGGL